jgi:hypothetical protein
MIYGVVNLRREATLPLVVGNGIHKPLLVSIIVLRLMGCVMLINPADRQGIRQRDRRLWVRNG